MPFSVAVAKIRLTCDMKRPGGYIDVDQLQAQTTLDEAAAKCGLTLQTKGSGAERRIDCPFGCQGDHCGRNEISINVDNPQKVFQCHAYGCGFRGNLLTLMHGWVSGRKPTADKLKGEEFQRIKRILAGQSPSPPPQSAKSSADPVKQDQARAPTPAPPVNVALFDSPEERVRELHNIDEKFVVDIAKMNPVAAAYVRRHPCLTPESMKKWQCGYLPNDGGGDKRGWSLRGSFVYPVFSETGKVLCWVGRDLRYEEKEREFQLLVAAEREGKDPPVKHRFPKGFHRGLELFGQQASRLKEPGYREFIANHGLIIVEGFNDVINLDNLGIPALGIMSNRITQSQIEKITRWARRFANNRVNLMFDNDEPGIAGAKDALWMFAEQRICIRLVWSPRMTSPKSAGNQPESVNGKNWKELMSCLI